MLMRAERSLHGVSASIVHPIAHLLLFSYLLTAPYLTSIRMEYIGACGRA
jgi:hypothetical protein